MRMLVVLAVAGAWLAGCVVDSFDPDRCTPPLRLACFCAGGEPGEQTCQLDTGRFSPCQCGADLDGGGPDRPLDLAGVAPDGGGHDGTAGTDPDQVPPDFAPPDGGPPPPDATTTPDLLTGTPGACTARLSVTDMRNGQTGLIGELMVSPIDLFILSGEGSTSSAGDSAGLQMQFRAVSAPPGSLMGSDVPGFAGAAWLLNHTGVGCPQHDPSAMPCMLIDFAGDYVFELRVRDATGCLATDMLTVHARPLPRIYLEATWVEDADLNLHLTEPLGQFGCAGTAPPGTSSMATHSDCSVCNCAGEAGQGHLPTFPSGLDWGGGDGMGDGVMENNPGYVGDRTCDLLVTPETVGVALPTSAPADGKYHVGLNFFDNCHGRAGAVVTPTLRIFIDGQLAAEMSKEMTEVGSMWLAARIDWSGDTATICRIDRLVDSATGLPVHPDDDADSICLPAP
jgi:hypothetical protein